MKLRADRFEMGVDSKAMEIIQGEVQRYKDEFKAPIDMQKGNQILHLYLQIAMDEGYRRVMEEMKEEMPYCADQINIKPRVKDIVEYVDEGEALKLYPLIKRRLKSKRQKKFWEKNAEEAKGDRSEELFTLLMVVNTGFEHGYLKASTIEETAKIVCKDEERSKMVLELFEELFPKELLEELKV